eukprot:13028119-Heterocapsa_arctica.AAC.1
MPPTELGLVEAGGGGGGGGGGGLAERLKSLKRLEDAALLRRLKRLEDAALLRRRCLSRTASTEASAG